MRTVIYGPVTQDVLDNAALLAGIEPTSYLTNGQWSAPTELDCTVIHPDQMCGDAKIPQNHWRLAIYSDAIIMTEYDEHMLHCAVQSGIIIYQE